MVRARINRLERQLEKIATTNERDRRDYIRSQAKAIEEYLRSDTPEYSEELKTKLRQAESIDEYLRIVKQHEEAN